MDWEAGGGRRGKEGERKRRSLASKLLAHTYPDCLFSYHSLPLTKHRVPVALQAPYKYSSSLTHRKALRATRKQTVFYSFLWLRG